DFERTFRAHMNTLEWMPTFLVPPWLCAIYLSDTAAAVLGLVWIVGRAMYFAGYSRAVEKRLPGFFIQSTVCFLLFIGAAAGIVMQLVSQLRVGGCGTETRGDVGMSPVRLLSNGL